MLDYNALLYDPIYSVIGVPAMMTTIAGVFEITVIDETRSKSMTSTGLEIRSIGPAACARIPELTVKGIDRSDYVNSILSFNGRMWVVYNYDLKGSPNGEDQGEVRFLLRSND